MTTGMCLVRGSLLIVRSTSIPSTSGSLMSSSTSRGSSLGSRPAYRPSQKRWSSASDPSRATSIVFAKRPRLNASCASSRSSGLSSTSSTRVGNSFMVDLLDGQGEVEGGADPGFGVGPHATAVAQDDAVGEGQPDAGALVVLGPVQPLEHAEELVRVAHVEAGPVVPDEGRGLAAGW